MNKKIISIVCDNEHDAKEILDAFKNKTSISWMNDAKQSLIIAIDSDNKIVTLSKSEKRYQYLKL